MDDLIKRSDAIEAVAEEWLSEASAESPYVNDDDIDRYRKLAEELFADIPSVELPKGDLISRRWLLDLYGDYIGDNGDPKYHVPLEVVRQNIIDAPSADAVHGEWIVRENGNKECSLCGHERQDGLDYFCGYCGARMKGGAE